MLYNSKRRLQTCLTVVGFGLIISLTGCQIGGGNQTPVNQVQTPVGPPSVFDGHFIGLNKTEGQAVAVVIDNYFLSRPPSGLNSAAVVYEAPVESNISRFLAIFSPDNLPNKIGPIRSARPYLAELADEYRAIFIHAGGSPEALTDISNNLYQINDVNGITADGVYFWRDAVRAAPFNLYTSSQNISKFASDNNIDNTADFSSWIFKDEPTEKPTLTAKVISIDNKSAGYFESITWRYDETKSCYLKYLVNNDTDQTYVDDQGNQICTKNLILQYTSVTTIDQIGRKKIDLDNGGTAKVYQDGQEIDGTWQKKNDRTRFYESSGQEIELLRGNTWVEIMPQAALNQPANP